MQHMHIIIMASNSQVAILHTQCIIVPTELYSHLLDDDMPCWSCCHPIIHFTHIQVTMLGWQWLWFFAAVLHCVRSLASLQLLCAWHGMSSLFKMWVLMWYSSLWIIRTSGATQISMWELGPKCCMACHGHIIPDFSVESTEIWYIINYRLIVPIFIPVNHFKIYFNTVEPVKKSSAVIYDARIDHHSLCSHLFDVSSLYHEKSACFFNVSFHKISLAYHY